MSAASDQTLFARNWELAWNSRDLEAVLSHFHEDALFSSPVASRIGFAPDGVVKGKAALRAYWSAALARNPLLHFKVTAVFIGVQTTVIAYTTQNNKSRIEVLKFRDGLVMEGHGLFATEGF